MQALSITTMKNFKR